jgi:hypothetical protein
MRDGGGNKRLGTDRWANLPVAGRHRRAARSSEAAARPHLENIERDERS